MSSDSARGLDVPWAVPVCNPARSWSVYYREAAPVRSEKPRRDRDIMRRKPATKAIVLVATLMAPIPTSAQVAEGDLRREARRLIQVAEIPGISLALVRSGRVIWSAGHGVANVETGASVNENTVFEAASLSKPVFAYAVLRLVDRGELDLDEPLWNTLEYERLQHDARARTITPRLVLTHTSGLPNWGDTPLELSYDPGSRWSYSGEGFVFLQRALERSTGLTLNELVQREVFDRLGMTRSSYVWRAEYDSLAATGHDLIGEVAEKRKPRRG